MQVLITIETNATSSGSNATSSGPNATSSGPNATSSGPNATSSIEWMMDPKFSDAEGAGGVVVGYAVAVEGCAYCAAFSEGIGRAGLQAAIAVYEP